MQFKHHVLQTQGYHTTNAVVKANQDLLHMDALTKIQAALAPWQQMQLDMAIPRHIQQTPRVRFEETTPKPVTYDPEAREPIRSPKPIVPEEPMLIVASEPVKPISAQDYETIVYRAKKCCKLTFDNSIVARAAS